MGDLDAGGIAKLLEWVERTWSHLPWVVKSGVWIVGVSAVVGVAAFAMGLVKDLWRGKPQEQQATWQAAPPAPPAPPPDSRVTINLQRFQATGNGMQVLSNVNAVNFSSEGGVGGSVIVGGDPDSGVATVIEDSNLTAGNGSQRGGDVRVTSGKGQRLDVKRSTLKGGDSK